MHHEGDLTVAEALIYAAICIFLTCLAGAMCRRRTWMRMCRNCRCSGTASGLTVGLLAIEPMNLKVIKATGTDDEKRSTPARFFFKSARVQAWSVRCDVLSAGRYAAKIEPIVEQHHRLLVSLLLTNAACMEALPIFLDKVALAPILSLLDRSMPASA
jgi:hypothetical protein